MPDNRRPTIEPEEQQKAAPPTFQPENCQWEGCESQASWVVPFSQQPRDFFCNLHAFEVVLSYATIHQNQFKPLYIQAFPISFKKIPTPVCMFVCNVGHVGRLINLRGKDEQIRVVGFYRDCPSCKDFAGKVCRELKNVWKGEAHLQLDEFDTRQMDVA